MTAKIWIPVIAGVAMFAASAVGLVYSLWFTLPLFAGVGLTSLGLVSLSELRFLRRSRDFSRPKIFRSSGVDVLLAGTGYSVIACSSPNQVKLALIKCGFFVKRVKDGYGQNIWDGFYLPEVDEKFSDVVSKRLHDCVKNLLTEAFAVEKMNEKSRAFKTWVELSQRGK